MSDLPLRTVLSASRTRDLVHRCPELLAAMLRGDAPVRQGRRAEARKLRPREVGVLVLWTKQPAPLVDHRPLCVALGDLVRTQGVLVDLQLTVTGFGGSPVEPGIPPPGDVARSLGRILDAGLVDPRAVKLRIDPLARVRFDAGPVFSNLELDVTRRVLDLFAPLGVSRVTASRLDDRTYPAVSRRMRMLGARVDPLDDAPARRVAAAMRQECLSRKMSFHTCVDPADDAPAGCIQGPLYNALLAERGATFRVDARPHSQVGTQRPGCACTYSRDVASSRGVRHCATAGFGCIYCYASGPGVGPAMREAVARALRQR